MTRLKIAELTSAAGVLALGLGTGSLLARWLAPGATLLTIAGVAVHAFGMWDKQRLETRDDSPRDPWVVALYWSCWVLLVGLVIALLFRV